MSNVRRGNRRPLAGKVQVMIRDFPDLRYDGLKIICDVCKIDLMCWSRRDCRRHVSSVYHSNRNKGVPQGPQFMADLLLMLISCNVPLGVLDKQAFRDFWNKYVPDVQLPSRTALRHYVPVLREDVIRKLKCVVNNKQLWLCVDETTDVKKHSVVHVIVRVLDPLERTFPLLLASKRLTECTSEVITRVVLETLDTFEITKRQVLMFVTDGAATMISVASSLQKHGCQVLHVTCKVHALHLVAETIRKYFPEVDALIANTKEVFFKSPKRLRVLHRTCRGIPEPPKPVVTRWGTWLKAALYYAEYFQQIKAVILQFNPEEAAGIKEIQTRFNDNSVETDLQTIRDNYKGLHDAIEKFQNGALSLAESLQIVDGVSSMLHGISDVKHESVRQTFESVLQKDTGFTTLKEICVGGSTNPLSACREYFNYACITSVDVERSFCTYKHIFSPKRTCLLESTMETYLMLKSFYGSGAGCDRDTNPSTSTS